MLFRIFPELLEMVQLRKKILNVISAGLIGRRALAKSVSETERTIRRECEVLKDSGFISFTSEGMVLTKLGSDAIEYLTRITLDVEHKEELELKLTKLLGIKEVLVVPGDDLTGVGIAGAKRLRQMLDTLQNLKKDHFKNGIILGLTGGSTIEKLVSAYDDKVKKDLIVVAARGGVGNRYEFQSNTLAEILASKVGGRHLGLQMQDDLSENMIELMRQEPAIKEVIETIKQINVLVFGIGRADVLASRRSLPIEVVEEVMSKGAVAEAFGNFFDANGNIVRGISTIGISLNQFELIDNVIGVASGEDKAEAVIAVSKLNPNLTLVTDESASNKIIEILENV